MNKIVLSLAAGILLCLVAAGGCRRPERETAAQKSASWFTEITEQAGLDFVHVSGRQGAFLFPEVMAGGGGVFDYDNDGDLDIYLINSGAHDGAAGGGPPAVNRLYRQEANGQFTDVTERSGLGHAGYGMGCAFGDIDNDGDQDVYVTNFGPDVLFRNNGDGTFTDITESAGVAGQSGSARQAGTVGPGGAQQAGGARKWSCSASFFDYDRDGLLDLYVTGYVHYSPPKACTDFVGRADYCGPETYAGVPDVLYHNQGAGRFQDVSLQAGIASVSYAGLGVYCHDFNEDGWIDVYVANDADPNNLWINQQGRSFTDEGVLRGAAYNRVGQTEAGMGITGGDADGDGDFDLFVTHLIDESNTYYRNFSKGSFEDATALVKLGVPSMQFTAFGTAFFDYDNDRDLDLAVVNGAVKRRPRRMVEDGSFWSDYAEPNALFENDGRGTFIDVSRAAGPLCAQVEVSRGLIPADFDNDGDLDLLVTQVDGRAHIFRNDHPQPGNWLIVRAIDPALQRDALGARVIVHEGPQRLAREVNPAFGYLCAGDARVHFGLRDSEQVARVTVHWPDGQVEQFTDVGINRSISLLKGSGEPPS